MWIVKTIQGNKIHRVLAYIYFCMYLWQYLAEFFLEWEIFQKKSCRENQNTFYFQQWRGVY